MRIIKTYHPSKLKDFYRAEKRIFNILDSLSFDQLADLCIYRGIKTENITKKQMVKSFMVSMGHVLSSKYFDKL